ncbi:hypothetical protein XENOCAPTIV_018152, partial [Xenoophorus captivus]
ESMQRLGLGELNISIIICVRAHLPSEYLWLPGIPGNPKKRARKTGCRSGVQVKIRQAAWIATDGVSRPTRSYKWLRPVPFQQDKLGSVSSPLPFCGLKLQCWSRVIRSPGPSWTSVVTPARPTRRCSWTSRDSERCLRSIPLCPADMNAVTSSTARHTGLLNGRSIANKTLSINELFTREKLDLLFLTETWQRDGRFIHLNELCPAG